MNKRYWEEILISLSLANLLFIGSWRKLIYPSSDIYHIKSVPAYFDYLSVWILVVITAGIFLGGLWLARRLAGGETPLIAKLAFLAVLFLLLNAFRIAFLEYYDILVSMLGKNLFLMLVGIAGIIGLLFVFKLKGRIFSVARFFVLILSPFIAVTVFQSITGIISSTTEPETYFAAKPAEEGHSEKNGIKSRVVWIIFDELDYKIPFEKRPADLQMPEFDRLEKESIAAVQATSPSSRTLLSMPSLVTGKTIVRAAPSGKSELILRLNDKSRAKFSEIPTVFSKVKNLGGHTALIGWYHPYCRILSKDLTDCYWETYYVSNEFDNANIKESLARDLRTFLFGLLGYNLLSLLESNFLGSGDKDKDIKRHRRMMDKSLEFVSNSKFDLVLIHLTIPHDPFYYDRHTEKFVDAGGYLDNLALSDVVLGRIRKEMEQTDLWDSSVVIVSSDHQWRPEDFIHALSPEDLRFAALPEDNRIPFFIKLKNQKQPFTFEKPFNTVITHDLILDLIRGNINTPEETIDWLKENGKDIPQIKLDL